MSEKDTQIEDVKKIDYVGFQGRIFATMLDLFLSLLILLPFAKTEYPPQVIDILNKLAFGQITNQQASQKLIEFLMYSSSGHGVSSGFGVEFIISGFVILLFWFYRSATPGKMFMQMKIVDADTGEKPTTTKLIIRYIGYIVSGIPLFLGFFWIAIDRRRQGWHDKLANTVVIYTNRNHKRHFIIVVVATIVCALLLLII